MTNTGVSQQAKAMIGELLEPKKVSCDVEYVMNELHNNGLLTSDELNQILNILEKKED